MAEDKNSRNKNRIEAFLFLKSFESSVSLTFQIFVLNLHFICDIHDI